MTEREAFVRRICEEPDCDAHLLVFADWLDECDRNPGYADYIRRGVAISRPWELNPDHDMGAGWDGTIDIVTQYPPADPDHCPLCRAITAQRTAPHTQALAASLGNMIGMPADWSGRRDSGPQYLGVRCRRGFVSELRLPAAVFVRHAAEIFRIHPVVGVTLTDRRPSDRSEPPLWGWYWGAVFGSPGDMPYDLPAAVARKLTGSVLFQSASAWRFYDTEADAMTALSRACVAYAREQAGLPPLPAPEPAG